MREDAPVQEQAYDAVASFLSDTGLGTVAGVLRAHVAGCGGKNIALCDSEAFAGRLRRLASTLGRLAADHARGRSAGGGAAEDWAEALRRKTAAASLSSDFSNTEAGPTSAHYVVPRQPGQTPVNFDPAIPDTYADDLDRGFQIIEVTEAELMRGGPKVPGAGGGGGDDDELMCASKASMDELLCAADVGIAPQVRSTVRPMSPSAPISCPSFGGDIGIGGPHPPTRGPPSPGGLGSPAFGSEMHGFGGDPMVTDPPAFGVASTFGRADQHVPAPSMKLPSFDTLKPVEPTVGIGGSPAFGNAFNASGPPEDDAPTFGGGSGHEAAFSSHPSFGGGLAEGPGWKPAFEAITEGGHNALQSKAHWSEPPPPPPPVVCSNLASALRPAALGQPTFAPASREERRRRRGPHPTRRYPVSGDQFYPRELDGAIFDSFALRVVYERDKTGYEDSKEFKISMNSVIAARYQVLAPLGEAAFSRAVKCLDLHTNQMVCMKIIKNNKDFFDQSLDEIKLLEMININTGSVDEKHCLKLLEYFYHKEHLIIVTELLRENLYEFSRLTRSGASGSRQPYFTIGRVQRVAQQVLVALEYIHGLWLIHADLKPENILLRTTSRCEVKVIDFGSSCFLDDELSSYVCSRSYRAPEVILGLPYDQKIDIWALGCIVAELWTGYALFQSDCIQSLLARIVGIIGAFPQHMMAKGRLVSQYFSKDGKLYREAAGADPSAQLPRRLQVLQPKRTSLRQRMRTQDEEFLDFLTRLLKVDPAERLSAAEALQHPWLRPGKYPDGL